MLPFIRHVYMYCGIAGPHGSMFMTALAFDVTGYCFDIFATTFNS